MSAGDLMRKRAERLTRRGVTPSPEQLAEMPTAELHAWVDALEGATVPQSYYSKVIAGRPQQATPAATAANAAGRWMSRVWGDRAGFASVALGHGGHFPPGSSSYGFARWEPRSYRWPDERDRLTADALALAGTADVYVGVLLRSERSRKQGTALDGPVAWADVDGTWTPARAAALARLEAQGVTVWQVASGTGGRHVYVALGQPQPVAVLEGYNRRLGVLLEADSGWSETKVLRLPGTYNHKPRAQGQDSAPVRWV